MNNEATQRAREALRVLERAADRDIAALDAAGREDEANLRRAARNIYGIFAQLLRKPVPEDVFVAQFDTLSGVWTQARGTAAAHDDFHRVAVEDAKLGALEEARAAWQAAKGGDGA